MKKKKIVQPIKMKARMIDMLSPIPCKNFTQEKGLPKEQWISGRPTRYRKLSFNPDYERPLDYSKLRHNYSSEDSIDGKTSDGVYIKVNDSSMDISQKESNLNGMISRNFHKNSISGTKTSLQSKANKLTLSI